MFLVIGAYTINFSVFDVYVMIGFGFLGLAMRSLEIPLAPLVLTLVLGPLMERSLRESLELSQGDSNRLHHPPHLRRPARRRGPDRAQPTAQVPQTQRPTGSDPEA